MAQNLEVELMIDTTKMKCCGLIKAETFDKAMKVFAVIVAIMHIATMTDSLELFGNLPLCCGQSEQGYDDGASIAGLVFAIISLLATAAPTPGPLVASTAIYNICATITFVNTLGLGLKAKILPLIFVSVLIGLGFVLVAFVGAVQKMCNNDGSDGTSRCERFIIVLSLFVSGLLTLAQLAVVIIVFQEKYDTVYFQYFSYIPGYSWDPKNADCSAISGRAQATNIYSPSAGGQVVEYCIGYESTDGSYPRNCCEWHSQE